MADESNIAPLQPRAAFSCDEAIVCPGTDSPIANLSSELPDTPDWLGTAYPPVRSPGLGRTWTAPACLYTCISTYSQELADLCAQVQAQACAILSDNPGATVYYNTEVNSVTHCPDGTEWSFFVPAGMFAASSQDQANLQAIQYGDRQVKRHRICLGPLDHPTATVGTEYTGKIVASGGFLARHFPEKNLWNVMGFLPEGLTGNTGFQCAAPDAPFNSDCDETFHITGTPTVGGAVNFTLRVTAPNGDWVQRAYTITTASACVGPSCASIAQSGPVNTVSVDPARYLNKADCDTTDIWTVPLISFCANAGDSICMYGLSGGGTGDTEWLFYLDQVTLTAVTPLGGNNYLLEFADQGWTADALVSPQMFQKTNFGPGFIQSTPFTIIPRFACPTFGRIDANTSNSITIHLVGQVPLVGDSLAVCFDEGAENSPATPTYSPSLPVSGKYNIDFGTYDGNVPITINVLCDVCTGSCATPVDGNPTIPDIFSGTIGYFAGGQNICAGNYTVKYVEGALKYNPAYDWSLNLDPEAFRVIYDGGTSSVLFPGTDGQYPSQADVEAANAGAKIQFTHVGGPIGVKLVDSPYFDNVAGSPNPTFAIYNGFV